MASWRFKFVLGQTAKWLVRQQCLVTRLPSHPRWRQCRNGVSNQSLMPRVENMEVAADYALPIGSVIQKAQPPYNDYRSSWSGQKDHFRYRGQCDVVGHLRSLRHGVSVPSPRPTTTNAPAKNATAKALASNQTTFTPVPTNSARVPQCRACGRRRPARISAAYEAQTLSADIMTGIVTPERRG